jgi:hypothetical protein
MSVILLLHWYCTTTVDKCLKVKVTGSSNGNRSSTGETWQLHGILYWMYLCKLLNVKFPISTDLWERTSVCTHTHTQTHTFLLNCTVLVIHSVPINTTDILKYRGPYGKNTLRVLKNDVLRPRRQIITRWRKLFDEEFRTFRCSPNINCDDYIKDER